MTSQLEQVASLVRSTGTATPAAIREARDLVFRDSIEVCGVECSREPDNLGLRWTGLGPDGLTISVFRHFIGRVWHVSAVHRAGLSAHGRGKMIGVAIDALESSLSQILTAIGSAIDSPVASCVPAAAKETE